MEYSAYDLYAMQLLHFFIVRHDYQIVRIQQHKEDFWLMNAAQEQYPVLRISSKPNAGTIKDEEYIRNVHRIILNLIHREGPIMIMNTNPQASIIENALINQVRVTKEGLSDKKLLRVFPDLDQVVHDVEDEAAEIVMITREIEEAQLHQKKMTLAKSKKAALPKATIVFMVICSAIFLLTTSMIFLTGDVISAIIASGGFYKMNVVAAHEYFRLLTAGFVHGDIFQLAIHLYIFYTVGKVSERMFSKKQYCFIFLLSIIVGNAFVLAAEQNTLSFGISAGVMGLMFAYLTALVENGSWRLPMVRISMIKIGWFGVLLLLVSGVPMIGILGGIITGVLLCISFYSPMHNKALVKNCRVAAGLFALVLMILCQQTNEVQPLEKEVDHELIQVYEHTPMQAYADYLKTKFNKQYEKE